MQRKGSGRSRKGIEIVKLTPVSHAASSILKSSTIARYLKGSGEAVERQGKAEKRPRKVKERKCVSLGQEGEDHVEKVVHAKIANDLAPESRRPQHLTQSRTRQLRGVRRILQTAEPRVKGSGRSRKEQ